MEIFSRSKRLVAIVALSSVLGACDDSDSSPEIVSPDTMPDSFTITPLTDAQIGAVLESEPVVISGLTAAAKISISGGEYSIDGSEFTSADGEIENGQSLVLRANNVQPGQSLVVSVNVGGVISEFRVSVAQDTAPEAFTFSAIDDAALNVVVMSAEAITVTGVTGPAPISITRGEYRIDSGTFTRDAGEVSEGQTVELRLTTASTPETASTATLNIGGVEGDFVVNTAVDEEDPSAEFVFPNRRSMTTANTLTLRGSASDDLLVSKISLIVSVEGEEVSRTELTEGDLENWTGSVTLQADAENEITVIATDAAGKTSLASTESGGIGYAQANDAPPSGFVVNVTQRSIFGEGYPASDSLYLDHSSGKSFVWQTNFDRLVFNADVPEVEFEGLLQMGIDNAYPHPFADTSFDSSHFEESDTLAWTMDGQVFLGLDLYLTFVNLNTDAFEETAISLYSPYGVAVNNADSLIYILDEYGTVLMGVDPNNVGMGPVTELDLQVDFADDIEFNSSYPAPVVLYGEYEEEQMHMGFLDESGSVSDEVTLLDPEQGFALEPFDFDYDYLRELFYLEDTDTGDNDLNSIYAVDLNAHAVKKIVAGGHAAPGMDLPVEFSMEVDVEKNLAVLFGPEENDESTTSFYYVDLQTGERVIFYTATQSEPQEPMPSKRAIGKFH